MTLGRILFVVSLLGTILALKTETIKKKVIVGKKSFKCTFKVKFTETTVDRNSSTVKCKPKKPTKKNVNVVLKTKDKKHKFNAKINLNPTSIQVIQMILPETLDDGHECGGYGETLTEEEKQDRSFTCRNYNLWGNGKVSWAFVSNGDTFDQHGFYTDGTVSLSKQDVEVTMEAMKVIEEKVGCIKFTRTKNPDNNEPWLLVMRESKCSTCECQRSYIDINLKNLQIPNLGKPFSGNWDGDDDCFGGAYVTGLGARKPSKLVLSKTAGSLGLLQHELLHVLGLGHTQKRSDRDSYITVKKENIKDAFESQYDNCKDDPWCGACDTHSIGYDCSSIMHYTNRGFSIEPWKLPTMVAKDPNTCDVTKYGTALTDYDVALLKKLYCKNGEIMSTYFPNDYPDYEDQDIPLKVVEGQIELTFTDFDIEHHSTCSYDYVEVLDSDNTQMMKKCGSTNPGVFTSKSNTMTVKFHSDYSVRKKGFKATWKQVGGQEGCVFETETFICGGNNVKQFRANSQYECASACASTDGCVGWTMLDSYSYCWLKSSDSCKGKLEGWITGTKACGVMNDCPANWRKGVHGCYNFIHKTENWSQAKERCKQMDAKLAEPETKDAFNEVINMAKIYHTDPKYWLGFTDINKEGTWVRDSDQQEAFKDFKSTDGVWHAGEPNNYGSNENCIHITGTLLNDIHCTATNEPVCQFNHNPVTYRMSIGVNTGRRASKIALNGTMESMDTPMKEDEN